jgi:hypothetical protein
MFKKIIASVVIVTQMSLSFAALTAMADDSQTATVTPEMNLVQNTLTIMGQRQSPQERQTELAQAVSDYKKAAQPDGQMDRMEQALVALKVYEPAQAHQLTTQAQAYASSSGPKSQDAVAKEISLLASLNPAGAQFEGCDMGQSEMLAGGIAAFIGLVVWVSGSSVGSEATCDVYGNNCVPDAGWENTGKAISGIGAVVLAVGVLTYTLAGDKCSDQ